MCQIEATFNYHCVKRVRVRSFFWSVFFRIQTNYGDIQSIQSECGKIRTRKTPNKDTFHKVYTFNHNRKTTNDGNMKPCKSV